MKLSVKGLMFASGIGWALIVLVVGVLNIIFEGYGEAYLTMLAAPFPWYAATGEIVDLIIGIVWALVIGGICGIVFAWLYNGFAGTGKKKKKAAPKRAAAKRPAAKKKKPAAKKKKPAAKKKKPAAKKKKPAAKKKKPAAKKKKPAAKKKTASKKSPKRR